MDYQKGDIHSDVCIFEKVNISSLQFILTSFDSKSLNNRRQHNDPNH